MFATIMNRTDTVCVRHFHDAFNDNSEILDAVYIRNLADNRTGRNDSWLVTLQLNGQSVTF